MIETGAAMGIIRVFIRASSPGARAEAQLVIVCDRSGLSTVRMARRKRRVPKITNDRKELSWIRPRAA